MITQNLPMVILPCSDKKQSYACKAIDMYLGTGYLPVLKSFKLEHGIDYQLFFVSAKYGLISADKIIRPYDQKMDEIQVKHLGHVGAFLSKEIILQYKPSKVIACLPKLYLKALHSMFKGIGDGLTILTPIKGAGIGSQRGFLKSEISYLVSGNVESLGMGK